MRALRNTLMVALIACGIAKPQNTCSLTLQQASEDNPASSACVNMVTVGTYIDNITFTQLCTPNYLSFSQTLTVPASGYCSGCTLVPGVNCLPQWSSTAQSVQPSYPGATLQFYYQILVQNGISNQIATITGTASGTPGGVGASGGVSVNVYCCFKAPAQRYTTPVCNCYS